MIRLFPVLQLRFDLPTQLLGGLYILRREHHVENDVHMMLPGDHAEIMKGQARVKPVHDLKNARAHGGDLRVVGDDAGIRNAI